MDTSSRSNSEDQRILGLQDLKITTNKDEDGTGQAHSVPASKSNSNSKTRPVGAIESFVLDNTQSNRQDYSFYERSNVIAASKFATPKRVETIASINKCDINSVPVPVSPTRSIDSLSQRSLSYQTEDLYEIPANPGIQFVPPVYENVSYYGEQRSPQPPYYHQMYQHTPPPPSVSDGYYDTRYSKAQPQVPVNSKVAHSVVYENMMCSDKDKTNEFKSQTNSDQRFMQQGSLPGPQVPNSYKTNTEMSMSNKIKDKAPPPPPYTVVQDLPGSDYTVMKSAPPKYSENTSLANKDNIKTSGAENKIITIPSTAIYASIAPSAQRPKANIATEVQTVMSSPKFYHSKPMSLTNSLTKEKLNLNGSYSAKVNTANRMHIIDDANGSDYVCMTGNASPASVNNRDNISLVSETLPRNLGQGLTSLCSPAQSPAPSPTPSSVSQLSGGSRGSGGRGKSLLPYSITPPRPPGPSEAQRKIEELTRQLEEEMEKQDEEGEYFGELNASKCNYSLP